MRLLYATTARLPTPLAHSLQIVENCAAFADAGAEVTLVAARRRVSRRRGQASADPRSHYGLDHTFAFDRLPCLDLTGRDAGASFRLMSLTFGLALSLRLLRSSAAAGVVYSRDPLVLALAALVVPRERLVYEAHQIAVSSLGRRLHARTVRSVGLVVVVTSRLDEYVRSLGARRTIVAPTGFRDARFAEPVLRADARRALGLAQDAYVVGYAGRLQTLGVSKGVDVIVDAAARLPDVPVTLAVVGGPDEMVDALRARWLVHGLPGDRFVAPGQVAASEVPTWLAAFDVGTMTFPFTPHFADCASPLKLFEYLAAGLPVVASHLPSLAEVLCDREIARFVRVSDIDDTADALRELYLDPGRRQRMATAARASSQQYLLSTRARGILAAIAAMDAKGTP